MQGQDFNTVTFGSNKKPGGGGGGGGGTTEAQKRPGGAGTSSGISAAKLENETEELKHATVSQVSNQAGAPTTNAPIARVVCYANIIPS